jgi:hypothetical protein
VGKINFRDGALISYGATPGPRESTVLLPYMPLGVLGAGSQVWVVAATSPNDNSAELIEMPADRGPAPKTGLILAGRLTCLTYPAASCRPVQGARSIWVPVGTTLYRISQRTGQVVDHYALHIPITAMAFGGGWVWLLTKTGLERTNAKTGATEPVLLSGLSADQQPARIAYAGDRVWIVCFGTDPSRNLLLRVDLNLPQPGIRQTTNYPDAAELAAAPDGLWVGTSSTPSTVRRFDPHTGEPTSAPITLSAPVNGLAPLRLGVAVLTYDPNTKVRRLAWADPTR